MSPTNSYLGSNRLLKALPSEDFSRHFPEFRRVSLPLRHVLQESEAPADYVYFIENGVISLLTTMSNASTIEVGMVGNEGMIGITALLDPAAPMPQAIVQIPGTAARMALAPCKRAFDESLAVRTVMLRFANDLLSLSSQTAACNRLHSIEQRCARWLLMAYDRVQSETMPMTHEFLASMLGVRRAGVTTAAAELQRSGLITYRQRQITIRDLDGLKASSCECHQTDQQRLNRSL